MKRNVVSVLVITFALAVSSTLISAQSSPTFELGFKVLASLIPDVVGYPIENEHYGANGDSLQQTSTGLMVWRRADNWTAFTNGSRTWVNGPFGVMERGNEERFEWEAVASPPTPTSTPAPVTPTPVPAEPLINKDQMAGALLRLSDMAAGYHTAQLGWVDDHRARAQYHPDYYPSGPEVTSTLYFYSSEALSQRAFVSADSGPDQFDISSAPMANVAASKMYFRYYTYQGGDTGEIWIVLFRVRNVMGEVRTTGQTSVSRSDLVLRLAQVVADRLAAQ